MTVPGRLAWVALGVGAYLVFLAAAFPAATAYRYFEPAVMHLAGRDPAELRLTGVEGTLWAGRAALGSAGGFALHDIRWDLSVPKLLTGRLAGRVQAGLPDGFVSADVSASPHRVDLRGVRASTSLPSLDALLPLKGMRGLVSLTLDRARLEDGRPTAVVGQARVAELAVPPLMPGAGTAPIALGNYEMVFKDTDGKGISAAFQDKGGPLEVSGTLTLDSQYKYTLAGYAAPRADAPKELVQGLTLMSEPDAQGRRRFSLNGSL